jgi:urease accessory protein
MPIMAQAKNTSASDSKSFVGLHVLLRLSSTSLPIGGYSYSQAMETAVEEGRVKDLADLNAWLVSALKTWAKGDSLLWALSYDALCQGNYKRLSSLNSLHWSSRDTSELRAETEQMGWSLTQLARDVQWVDSELGSFLKNLEPSTFLTAHVCTCWSQRIDRHSGLTAFCLAFIDGQVQAAQKLLPIGQAVAQRLLSNIQSDIDQCVSDALESASLGEAAIHTSAPLHSILSARHEFQYSRLFRS